VASGSVGRIWVSQAGQRQGIGRVCGGEFNSIPNSRARRPTKNPAKLLEVASYKLPGPGEDAETA